MAKLITVFGATGAQGGGVVDALLSNPAFKVRAVTRNINSEKAKSLQTLGAVEVVSATLDDIPSVEAALKGAYGCFVVTNYWEHMDRDKEIKQGRIAVDAAKSVGIKHFVYSGLENVKKIIGIDCEHFDGKGIVEEYLQKSGLPFTSVRYSFYFDNFLGTMAPRKVEAGKFSIDISMGKVPLDGVSVRDAGEVIHQIFARGREYQGRFVGVTGDKLTIEEYAAILTKHLGPKLFVDGQVTLEQMKAAAGSEMANMFEFNQRGNPVRDLSLCRKLHPNMPNFEQWLIRNKDEMNNATK